MKTSLLEGSIRVGQHLLQPGQAYVNGRTITTNLEQDVAWKVGLFSFNETDLKGVMRQISRWYDVEIVYEGPAPTRTFSGKIQKGLKLADALFVLERSDVHFRMEGKKLIVTP